MASSLVTALLVAGGLFFGSYIGLVYQVQRLWAMTAVSPPPEGTDYDFLVVGSGTAGSVVAARLADAGFQVLLIEAGGPPHPLQFVPAMSPFFVGSPYDWAYKIESNGKSGLALEDGGAPVWPRGKELGGSSMLNWMLNNR